MGSALKLQANGPGMTPTPSSQLPVRLIINGDDLGISREVNDAIFALMAQGYLRSATLLMNTPAAVDASREIPKFPGCSFGIHLNLTYHTPLTNNPDLSPLLNNEGFMYGEWDRQALNVPQQRAIFQEWCAQIDMAKELGVPISHLDSHHHVHTIPCLAPWLKQLKQRYAINRVRGSWTVFPALGHVIPAGIAAEPPPLHTTEAFCAFRTFVDHFAGKTIQPAVQTWELMTHPGAPHDGDTILLQSSWQQRLPFPVEIISFNDL